MRLFRWLVCFLAVAVSLPAQQDVWTGVERVVAVGDVHGDYKQFLAVLESAGVIDRKQKWTGGKTHLVQTGDVVDRGPGSRKVMDLLMNLERQAERAGGRVHALIGNHEAMNVYGDLRYVSPGEYEAFKDGRSKEVRDAFFDQHVEEMKKKTPPQSVDRAAWDKENPLGFFEHRMAFGPKGNYGRWIRRHNAVVRINDAIFLHGGVGPKYASLTGNAINTQIRAELEDFTRLQGGAAMDPEGPLWYRGLAEGAEGELAAHLDAVLKSHGAARVVIGHTPTDGAVLPRFNGRVVMIDVGLSAHYGSRTACLVIEKDQWFALHRGKKLPLPGAGVVEYLKQAAALDPPPSPLAPLIKKLEGN